MDTPDYLIVRLESLADDSAMKLDDELCLCFHVSKRKVLNYLRVRRPRVASQLSECGGAGTGCGWCVPFLKKLHRQSVEGNTPELPSSEEYAAARGSYIAAGKGTPPALGGGEGERGRGGDED